MTNKIERVKVTGTAEHTKDKVRSMNKLLKNTAMRDKIQRILSRQLDAKILAYDQKWSGKKKLKPYKQRAIFRDVPLELGESEFVNNIRKYLNRDIYQMRCYWRGGYTKRTSKVPGIMWDFMSKANWWYRYGLVKLTAERTSIYIEPKQSSVLKLQDRRYYRGMPINKLTDAILAILETTTDIEKEESNVKSKS